MGVNPDEGGEGFLRRWSRVKIESREAPEAPAAPAATPAPAQPRAGDEPPELPPIEKLTLDSDFSGFFHPKVDEDLRRRALRKLFSDPHFNVMDGLDVYIDDYSKTEPIPAAMLASLKQAQRILEWAADNKDAAGTQGNERPSIDNAGSVEAAPAQPPSALEESPTHTVSQTALDDRNAQPADVDTPASSSKT
jgi:hypothetical protein